METSQYFKNVNLLSITSSILIIKDIVSLHKITHVVIELRARYLLICSTAG